MRMFASDEEAATAWCIGGFPQPEEGFENDEQAARYWCAGFLMGAVRERKANQVVASVREIDLSALDNKGGVITKKARELARAGSTLVIYETLEDPYPVVRAVAASACPELARSGLIETPTIMRGYNEADTLYFSLWEAFQKEADSQVKNHMETALRQLRPYCRYVPALAQKWLVQTSRTA